MSVYNFTESHGVSDTTRLEDEADAWDTDPDFVVYYFLYLYFKPNSHSRIRAIKE